MTDKPNKHGGIRQGQGRKPLAEGEKTVKVNLTITESQRGQLLALGGSAWLREQLNLIAKTGKDHT